MGYRDNQKSRQHKLFWGSSYDRGLDMLLNLWPQIKLKFPDATLDICYGWNLFISGYKDNPERMNWMNRIDQQMKQPGITHHGRLSKKELTKVRQACGIWAYPTYFTETNCITALDCQRDGVVPCTVNLAGLEDSVQSGVKVEGDIYDDETKEAWLEGLFKLMSDKRYWQAEQEKGRQWAENFTWDKIARRWEDELKA